MSSDCSPHIQEHRSPNPHDLFAEYVEQIAITMCGVSLAEFWAKHKKQGISKVRFIVWSIVYQKYGFRNLDWLCRRYNIKERTTISKGMRIVEINPELKQLQTHIRNEVASDLTTKGFGYVHPTLRQSH